MVLESAGTWRAFHHTGHFMSPEWGLLVEPIHPYLKEIAFFLLLEIRKTFITVNALLGTFQHRLQNGKERLLLLHLIHRR